MKKMKGWVIGGVVACSVLLAFTMASADPRGIGVFGGYGQSTDNIDVFRLGFQKSFSSRWFDSRTGALSGYFELSYNWWDKSGDTTHGVGFSPVFAYYFNPGSHWPVIPYIEGGIGVAYINDYRIAGRNLSSNFQFEDRIGIGIVMDRMDIKLGYMHYSNAGLAGPNEGIDILIGTVTWQF